MAIFFPPPPPHVGGHQPHAGRDTVPPSIAAVPVNDPPFQHPALTVPAATIVMAWQPNPWTYSYFGKGQPFQPGALPPTRIENPPLINIDRALLVGLITSWQPPPPHAYMGGRQALEPRRLAPSQMAVRVDNPPIQQRGRIETMLHQRWIPGPPMPTLERRSIISVPRPISYIIIFT